MIYTKINKDSVKTEFNNTPYTIVRNLKLVNEIEKTRDRMLAIIRNEHSYDLEFIEKMKQNSSRFIKLTFPIVVETKFMLDNNERISKKQITPSNFKSVVYSKSSILTHLSKEDIQDNKPIFRTINGIDKNVFRTLAHNDEVTHICYLDKNYYKSTDNYSDKNKSILNSYRYGSKYFYVDRNNIKSFIRPLFDVLSSDYIAVKSLFKLTDLPCGPFNRNLTELEDRDVFKSDSILEEFLLNKIIITKFKRINTSLGNIISKNKEDRGVTYISNYVKDCPILQSYLEKGYKILHVTGSEDTTEAKVDLLTEAYSKLKHYDTLKGNDLDFDVSGSFIVDTYKGINIENEYKKQGNDNLEIVGRNNLSIILVKVDYIDISKSNIEKENCIYVPEHDILIGEINDRTVNDRYNILEEVSHPYSGYTDITTDMYKEREIPVILDYVINSECLHKPLYVNIFGSVEQLIPRRDPRLAEGVYVKSTKEKRLIKPEDYAKYGIFYNEEMAIDYIDIINTTDNNKQIEKYLDAKITNKKFELESFKIKHEKEKLSFTSNTLLLDHIEKKKKAKIEEKTNSIKLLKEIFSVVASIVTSVVTVMVVLNKQKS